MKSGLLGVVKLPFLIALFAGHGALFPAVSWASLVTSVLPTSRSIEVGNTATAFATVINMGPGTATGCSISPATPVPANFLYQTTDSATNALTGTPNTPVDIAEGAAQTFLFAFTPTAPFAPTDVQLSFACTNTVPAASISGLNTLLLSGSSTPVPDIIALATGSGVLDLPASAGWVGAFAVATVNVGATGTITASADTGSATLPVTLSVCETNPSTGVCINPTSPAATATTTIEAGNTPTFAFFASAHGPIDLDPANKRAFVRFRDSGGANRGSTSVALSAIPPIAETPVFKAATKVFKYDRAVQCESSGIKLDTMALELINAGIEVACSQKGHDGFGRTAVCGGGTGNINIRNKQFEPP